MINAAILEGLKRVNVSTDKEKTKERIEKLWKSATKAAKNQILTESDVKAMTVYRVYREGAITPRVALVMADVFNADPFYITGETEENAGFNDQVLDRFLREKGYAKLLDATNVKPKRKYQRRMPKASEQADGEPQDAPTKADEALEEVTEPCNSKEDAVTPENADCVSDDELMLLLRALIVRAKRGKNAVLRVQAIKDILYED